MPGKQESCDRKLRKERCNTKERIWEEELDKNMNDDNFRGSYDSVGLKQNSQGDLQPDVQ